jgi:mannose-1-phosphate guanylyltransferase
MSLYAVILAGGSGRRFWPLSRDAKPKQLLQLLGATTMLEQALDRVSGLVPRENILILTNVEQEATVRELLPDFPAENIVAEPTKRDTAPAIALGIGWVAKRDPNAVMAILPSDQLIKDTSAFQQCLADAAAAAREQEALVTIGIKPTWPCSGYGYVERGERASISTAKNGSAVYEVRRFREKPSTQQAQEFLDQGNFVWNAGMFVWSLPTVRKELGLHCPPLAQFVEEVSKADNLPAFLQQHFAALTPISIDFALMEKAGHVLSVESTFDWDDVGSWISVGKYLPTDAADNASNSPLVQIDASGNIVFAEGKPQVALLGVKDLIVVQTADALVVADRNQADAIKKLVDLVPKALH